MTNKEPTSGRRLSLLKRYAAQSSREANASNITLPANKSLGLKDNAI